MKKTITFATFLALALAAGCASSNKTDSGSMGVVDDGHKGSCCSQKSEGGSMGVVADDKCSQDKGHCSSGGACPMQGKSDK